MSVVAPILPARLSGTVAPPFVLRVVAKLHGAGHQAFLVGGCVRDLLRGVQAKDFDLATSARPEQVLELFRHTVPTGLQHGTVTVVESEGSTEVTTFRGEEGYQDGRRPDRVFFLDSIEADLARRDFTINAMAFDPVRCALVDPHGGYLDLGRRVVRCVGEADARFGEDGLRALRAVRFAGVLRFEIDPETLAAIPRALATYGRVAIERIGDELRKLLHGPRPSRALHILATSGLASRILPVLESESAAERELRLARVDFLPPTFALRLAALFRDQSAALEELKLPNALRDRVLRIDRLRPPADTASDAHVRRFLSRVTLAGARDGLKLMRADALARRDSAALARWRQLVIQITRIAASAPPLVMGELALNGTQVGEALGVRGPQVGQALRDLLEAVLEDPSRNTAEQLRELLRRR